jgi:2-octaprenylphenol hydroxylase
MQNNSAMQYFDVVIVGAGAVGAAQACALAQEKFAASLRIAVIETGTEPTRFIGKNFDPRVVALTQASQRLLQHLGCWAEIVSERVCPFHDITVWDGEGTAHIEFSSADIHATHLGHIVENSVVVRALRSRIAGLPQIQMIQPASLVALQQPGAQHNPVQLTLDNGISLQTPLLIAADGAQSAVREFAKFETREWDYGQHAIVTTVRTELSHRFTASQRFTHNGPLAFLPLQNDGDARHCSIVWSAEENLAQELMQLSDTDFCARLGAAFEYRLGAVEHCADRFCIPLRQRHARQYFQPGIVLVGDAAHSIHPLAGQGVNLGLLDVAALTKEIQRGVQRELPLSDISILRRYQRQRLAGNLAMMSAMEGFKQLFGHRSLAMTLLRNTGMRELNSLPLLKNFIMKHVVG